MKPHVKTYLKFFGYSTADFIPCEICGGKAVDIHHLEARGMGGTNEPDKPDNLMALCWEHHLEYGDKKQWIEFLKAKHKETMLKIKTTFVK